MIVALSIKSRRFNLIREGLTCDSSRKEMVPHGKRGKTSDPI